MYNIVHTASYNRHPKNGNTTISLPRLHSPAATTAAPSAHPAIKSVRFTQLPKHYITPKKTMTIKVEREALITVLTRRPSWPSSPCDATSISPQDDEFVVVNLPNKSSCLDTELIRCSSYSDEDSVCTLSTSSESLSTDSSLERRVSFAPSLVTDEWTRPFTPREEIPSLFYSTEDTHR